jgi:hypothetical protein
MLTEPLAVAASLGGLLTVAALAAPVRTIETVIDIPAPPSEVWQVLTDGPAYADWNPFIRSMSGTVVAGERLTNRMHPQGGRPMTFRPRVLVADPGRELRWLGRLGLPRIFDGEHFFRLEATGDGTRMVHGETFRGLLLWVMGVERFRADFTAMNLALRDRVLVSQDNGTPNRAE